MKLKKKNNDNLNIRLNNELLDTLKKRANKLDLEVSTYIRTLIRLDNGYNFFEVITKNVDKDLIKRFDKKSLLINNKRKVKKV